MADDKKTTAKLVYESKESLYAKAVEMMEIDELIVKFAFKVENYQNAADMLDQIGDYKDAKELARQCRELAKKAKENEKEYQYGLAIEMMEEAKSAKQYEKTAKMFEAVPGYLDADEKKQECLDRKREREKRSRVKKMVYLGVLAVIVVAAALFFTSETWQSSFNKVIGKDAITLESCTVGDKVNFGIHEWYVMEKGDTKVKLILNHAEQFEELRHTPYNETEEAVTWETCSLREWLNGPFLEEHFTPEEQERIMTADIITGENPTYGTAGGNDTQDKVFLMSMGDVTKYHDVVSNIKLNSWLRTPGHSGETACFMAPNTVGMDYGYTVTGTHLYTCPVICVELEREQ